MLKAFLAASFGRDPELRGTQLIPLEANDTAEATHTCDETDRDLLKHSEEVLPYLSNMGVHPDHQVKGIGSVLLEHVTRHADEVLRPQREAAAKELSAASTRGESRVKAELVRDYTLCLESPASNVSRGAEAAQYRGGRYSGTGEHG
jgi:GNAT superfamily N-acetyltransferase